ncbi:hypothetical protein WOC76_15480 [Methylocystis sp. IM3]|uniref:hypothetical protein n=1 Tax=unclassified Methylocystis TaxID=2625913 RepID=UPI0030F64197
MPCKIMDAAIPSKSESPPRDKENAAPLEQRDGKEKVIQSTQNYQRAQQFASAPGHFDALRRELIIECGELIASLGLSLAEAAWRGDDRLTEAHLRQLIAATRAACATFREIVPGDGNGGAR